MGQQNKKRNKECNGSKIKREEGTQRGRERKWKQGVQCGTERESGDEAYTGEAEK